MNTALEKIKWEEYIGRRQPPLRTEITLNGAMKWLEKNGFGKKYYDLYLYFSDLIDKNIISDSYINVNKRKKLTNTLKEDLKNNEQKIFYYIEEFTVLLKKFKKKNNELEKIKVSNNNLLSIFNLFCANWESFGPVLFIFLLVADAYEELLWEKCNKNKILLSKLQRKASLFSKSHYFNKKKKTIVIRGKFKNEIIILSKLIELRDARKISYEKGWYKQAQIFLQFLEKYTGLNKEIYFLNKKNVIKAIKKQNIRLVKLPVLVYGNKTIKLIYGKQALFLKNSISTSIYPNIIKGNIANNGKTKGKVRIIVPHLKNQIFKQGEIIVTKMTTPDLMQIIKKAAAIVTDEGGITCHAAIVSRELNIPCIIGTKYATKVLKNGDNIEVDANVGAVNKL